MSLNSHSYQSSFVTKSLACYILKNQDKKTKLHPKKSKKLIHLISTTAKSSEEHYTTTKFTLPSIPNQRSANAFPNPKTLNH